MTPYEQVTEFHHAFGCAINQPWTMELGNLRAGLIEEECQELTAAVAAGNQLGIAQELADLAYVTIGAAVSLGLGDDCDPGRFKRATFGLLRGECAVLARNLVNGDVTGVWCHLPRVLGYLHKLADAEGINLDAAVSEVHRANMSKLGADGKPIRRADGKVLKGPGYQPPDMTIALMSIR